MASLSIIFGAFGAHLIKSKVSVENLNIFETGVRYQMYHSLGIMLIGIIGFHVPHSIIRTSASLLFFGTLIFSGSLYILVLANIRWMGAITPIGGIFLVLGWLNLFYNIYRN